MKTLKEQLACAKRELELRRRVYPKWVQEQRSGWNKQKSLHEIACMEAIVATVERALYLEEVSNEMLGRKTQQVDLI